MPLTQGEIDAINSLMSQIDEKVNEILNARDDVRALLRIVSSINNDVIEGSVLADAKSRAKTAASAIVGLL